MSNKSWYVVIDGINPVSGIILCLTEDEAMSKRLRYKEVANSGTTLFVSQLFGPYSARADAWASLLEEQKALERAW